MLAVTFCVVISMSYCLIDYSPFDSLIVQGTVDDKAAAKTTLGKGAERLESTLLSFPQQQALTLVPSFY